VQYTITLDVEGADNMDTVHVRAMLQEAIQRQYDNVGLTSDDDEALVNGFQVAAQPLPSLAEALRAVLAYEDDQPAPGTFGSEVYSIARNALSLFQPDPHQGA
jgi:hypothetical protein